MTDLPLIMTKDGPVPTPPAVLRADLVADVAATNPDYTANLPSSLIEDTASTDVGALAIIDSARVELVGSITPFGANAYLINQQGQMLGVPEGRATLTSVFVIFTGPPGLVIGKGFTVTDGIYQYVIADGGIIGAGAQTSLLFAQAVISGSWAVPEGSVTGLITSVPDDIDLTVTNPGAGLPAAAAQSQTDYRASVMQAQLAIVQGSPTMLRTALARVAGVQQRLVSIIHVPNNGGWEIIVGGGDPYEVAYAIFVALGPGITQLVGSTLNVVGVSNANPAVISTDLNHGYTTGQTVEIAGVLGPVGVNGTNTATVVDEKSFSIPVSTTLDPAYGGGGVVTPNFRNIAPAINNFPNVYVVPYVIPPQQTVAVAVTWNTSSNNFVSDATVAQLSQQPLVDYINGIYAGQPINLLVMRSIFEKAVAAVIPTEQLTRLVFAVSINGIGTSPDAGSEVIFGDPESYMRTTVPAITVTKG